MPKTPPAAAPVSDTAAARLPRQAIAQAVTAALQGLDFAHAARWSCEGCPCQEAREEGQDERSGCISWQLHNPCQGHSEDDPLPPGQSITADELVAVLPAPDKDGTVMLGECWSVMGELATERLAHTGQHPYWLRQLCRSLGDALRELAGAEPPAAPDEPAPGELPLQHCAGCGDLYRPRRTRSRYCSGACRQAAYAARQLARQA
jgi:hypothetical protein